MDIDELAISYCFFAQAHDPLPARLALCPASVPLALPTTVTQNLIVLPIPFEGVWATTVDVTPEIERPLISGFVPYDRSAIHAFGIYLHPLTLAMRF